MPRLILLLLALAASLRAAPLAFRWSPEISGAEPFRANAFHGETVTLCATPLQYGEPLTGLEGARAALYWQTPDMEPTQWYTAPGTYDAGTGTLSAEWTPAMDVGSDRVTFFLALTQGDAVAYRVYGTLTLRPSPGFSPAALIPVDVRDELADQIADDVKAWADTRYLPTSGGTVTGVLRANNPKVSADADPAHDIAIVPNAEGLGLQLQFPGGPTAFVRARTGVLATADEVTASASALSAAVRAGTDAQGERLEGMISNIVASPNVASGSACDSVTVAVRVTVPQDYAPQNLDLVRLAQWDRGSSYVRLTSDGRAAVTLNGAGSSVSAPFGAGDHTLVASYDKVSDTDTRVTLWLDGSLLQERLYTGLNGLNLFVGGSAAGYNGLTYETEILRGIVFGDADLSAFSASGLIPLAEAARMTLEKTRADIASLQSAGYLTEETDPTVPEWAKAASKPAYAWSEITGRPATYAPSAHAHAASDISTGTLSYMRLPAAETLRRGAVYPGGGLTVNDLGRLSVIPGDGLTLTDANALAVTPGLYAPASHTHAASDVDGLHSHAPQSAAFVVEGDGSAATLTVPEGLGPLLADTASSAAEAYRITADLADWPTDGAVRDVIVRNASSALTLDADALTLADYDLLTANATLGLRFTRVGTRIVVSILWRSEL